MKWSARILLAFLLAVLVIPTTVSAAEFRGGQDETTVPAAQVIDDDLYIAGQTVIISGTVNGDLVAAGSNVTVEGNVTGSVWVGGGNVTINGTVGHSLRVAGGNVTIKGTVAGDVLVGGGNVTVDSSAVIGRDLVAGSSDLTVNGSVGRNLKAGGDRITIGGPVKGSVTAETGDQFTLAKGAVIGGSIDYSGPTELKRDPSAQVAGAVDYTKRQDRGDRTTIWDRLAGQTYWFIASVILLLAILLYARRAAVRAAELITERPGGTILAGIGFALLTPIVGLIFLITVFGIPLSVITFLTYGLVLYTAKLFPALLVGRTVLKGTKQDSFWPTFGAGVLGLAVFYLLAALPGIGWLVTIAAVLFGTGAQLFLFREIYGSVKKQYGA